MDRWKTREKVNVKAGDLEMTATIFYKAPQYSKLGKVKQKGEWHGRGYSPKSWGNWPYHNRRETNIGDIEILNQALDKSGLFSVDFIGFGDPKGNLATEIGIPTD